jgi:hypothetical protein
MQNLMCTIYFNEILKFMHIYAHLCIIIAKLMIRCGFGFVH